MSGSPAPLPQLDVGCGGGRRGFSMKRLFCIGDLPGERSTRVCVHRNHVFLQRRAPHSLGPDKHVCLCNVHHDMHKSSGNCWL